MIYAAAVLLVRRGLDFDPRVLAVSNRAYGGMSLPGGKLDCGESFRACAARELLEETGLVLRADDLSLIARGVNAPPTIDPADVTVFFARYAWGQPRDVEPGTRHEWLTFDQLCLASPFADFYRRELPDGVHHLRETIFVDASTAPRA